MALKKPKLADTATTKSKASANAPVLDLDWMRSQAAQVVSLLKVIGNPDRLLLLCQMLEGISSSRRCRNSSVCYATKVLWQPAVTVSTFITGWRIRMSRSSWKPCIASTATHRRPPSRRHVPRLTRVVLYDH